MKTRDILTALALAAALLAGCAPAPAETPPAGTAPAETAPAAVEDAPVLPGLTCEGRLSLSYAQGFSVYRYEGGYSVIQVEDGGDFLVVPEGGEVPDAAGYTVLQQPLDRVYLAATSAMALFRALDALDAVRYSGTKRDGWYIPEAVRAMDEGTIVYAGKYSSPDYELLTGGGCDLAVESTMLTHAPEVGEKLEELGIPVFVDRSSYEPHPLGRTEWMKLYGALLGKEEEAERAFRAQMERVEALSGYENTEKTAAFFYVNSSGAVSVRKSSDYLAKMIELAGGRYVFSDLGEDGTATSTTTMTMEEFYQTAREADYLIYNSTLGGPVETLEDLLGKSGLFADFKAVQEGNVWRTDSYLYQATDVLGSMIGDLHAMLSGTEETHLTFIHKLS